MRYLSLLLVALLVVAEPLAFAGQSKSVRMCWADLDSLIRGRRVSVSTAGGTTCNGTVRAIDSDSLSLTGGANPRLRRVEITEIRVTEFTGNGRHFGKLAGGAVGLPLGLLAGYFLGRQIDKEITVIRIVPE
jgi:hypothetical protein